MLELEVAEEMQSCTHRLGLPGLTPAVRPLTPDACLVDALAACWVAWARGVFSIKVQDKGIGILVTSRSGLLVVSDSVL